jgi:hypothetical protein
VQDIIDAFSHPTQYFSCTVGLLLILRATLAAAMLHRLLPMVHRLAKIAPISASTMVIEEKTKLVGVRPPHGFH